MATYRVTKVSKENAKIGSHQHIVGVVTDGGQRFSNQQVIDSIKQGSDWYTSVKDVQPAKIKPTDSCPNCSHKPYLTTAPDHTAKNNLENLPLG